MRSPLLLRLTLFLALWPLVAQAQPQWIWIDRKAQDNEEVTFETRFELPAEVKNAALTFTCDDGAAAFVNGRQAGPSVVDWENPVTTDVKLLVHKGSNVLRFTAKNKASEAGLLAILTVTLQGADSVIIESGPTWEASRKGSTAPQAQRAVVVGKYGAAPWGDVLADGAAEAAEELQVAEGFRAERLYSVPRRLQGTWVAMTQDAKGRLIVADQTGGLYRVTVPPVGTTASVQVEPLTLPKSPEGHRLGGAHGLLYAFDSLYVMVNQMSDKGLWRLRETDGDDQFDRAELVSACNGSGEHGPHGLTLGPDGHSIYFVCGNFTELPAKLDAVRPVAIGEDLIVPRLWDANGFGEGLLAPGGYIAKTDPEGKRVELVAGGLRNAYDLAFDANGELFTYDSDMEWDVGAPWYVPTRINHVVNAADYGWRSGAGRWPAYYEDSLPAVIDLGRGCPTGTVFGTGAKFPAKYQQALFALDWTYGKIRAIHLAPDGASFRAESEDFVSGKSFPVTDAIVGAKDGALYVTTGGRRNQAGLYRITYTGTESTAPAKPLPATPAAKQRQELEKLSANGTGPVAIEQAWPQLASPDRFLRWTARVALEHQPPTLWAERALAEMNPQAAIEALIGLVRVGDRSLQPRLITALEKLDYAQQPAELRLPLLRAWELVFTRMGKPAPEAGAEIAAKFATLFPQEDPLANRELLALLVFLDAPAAVTKAVPMLATVADSGIELPTDEFLTGNKKDVLTLNEQPESRPNRQAIAYAYALRNATAGWTPELRKTFFAWFPKTNRWKGGNSFTKFIENIRKDALKNVVLEPDERTALDDLSQSKKPVNSAPLVGPKGPGRAYTLAEVAALAPALQQGRNFAQGKAMFAAAQCATCHHFNGDGGNVGPDLTGVGNRYTLRDLLENIMEPSKVISDQYGSEVIEKKDGSVVVGRVISMDQGKLQVMTSGFAPDALTPVALSEVKSRKPADISMMPPGLINALNENELLDLLAYLMTGGNPADRAFVK